MPEDGKMTDKSVRARLTFPEDLVAEPVIAKLALEHGVIANIRRANVEDHTGWIVCELTGTRQALDAGVEWLTQTGVRVDWLGGPVES
jgi:ABC-type methionine transport system ATPase subunit